MYKIDWKKYLNPNRLRHSDKDVKRNEGNGAAIAYFDKRSPFESDFGRVAFSSAARRMHDKTQVFPLNLDDNIHTRLTHSIEVMNIGYSIGVSLTRNKDFIDTFGADSDELAWQIVAILKTACFIHDIGNPPFGHFGEDAIKTYFERCFSCRVDSDPLHLGNGQTIKNISRSDIGDFFKFQDTSEKYDFIQFDGNAEGFRIVTKLQYLDDLYGLNLTEATLAAYTKYPNCNGKKKRVEGKEGEFRIAQSKHGVFHTEEEYLKKIAQGCNMELTDDTFKRHPLSYLVEAADSICYLVMDIEDSVSKDWHTLATIEEYLKDNKEIVNLIQNTPKTVKMKDADGNEVEKTKPAKKCFVDFRVALIDYFVDLAVKNFIDHLEEIDKGEYNKELIKDDANKVAEDLGNFCRNKIFGNKEIVKLELAGDAIIKSLLDHYMYLLLHEEPTYVNRARTTIPSPIINIAILEYSKEEKKIYYTTEELNNFDLSKLPLKYRLRIIRDHIVLMTDKYAMNLNNELNGQRL